jgi:hypothetical protein
MMFDEMTETIRCVAGVGWQVSVDGEEWHTCRKEQDARFIAFGVSTADAVFNDARRGEEVASELDEVVAMMGRQVGECPALERMRSAAVLARSAS